jgi:hypothetical protein
MKKSFEERREFIRVPFSTEIEVRTPGRTIRSSDSLNVSMNGLRFTTTEPAPEEGTPCQIRLVLSGGDPRAEIEAKGIIVRSAPGDLAVHFTELEVDGYQHLCQLILNNTDDPDQAERELAAHWGIRGPNLPFKN